MPTEVKYQPLPGLCSGNGFVKMLQLVTTLLSRKAGLHLKRLIINDAADVVPFPTTYQLASWSIPWPSPVKMRLETTDS